MKKVHKKYPVSLAGFNYSKSQALPFCPLNMLAYLIYISAAQQLENFDNGNGLRSKSKIS